MTTHGLDDAVLQDDAPDRGTRRGHAFHVFLSYNSRNRDHVERIARRLERQDIRPWFDRWSLTPGGDWQDEIARGLHDSSACAVFIGPDDLGAWTRMEVSVALNRAATERGFRIFPVLLPGLEPFEPAGLPPFLATRTWVDMRAGRDSEGELRSLINAVLGVAPGSGSVPGGSSGPCPYRGLEAFEERHARFYFGREAHLQRLLEKLKGGRFVVVVGPSGSGKSSLVRAGLLPRLRAADPPWRILVLRPGAHPLAALAGALAGLAPAQALPAVVDGLAADERTLHLTCAAALADEPAGTRVLVVVDQCEELFTLCDDALQQTSFLANLHYASTIPGGRTAVVPTLRADFYPRLVDFPDIAQLAQSHQMLVGAMRDHELRQVIEEPARAVGLDVEPGLVDTILADAADHPGTLPLLEHALLETWRRRRGGLLTLAGYREAGGVRRGLADRAEALYTALTPDCQEVARNLLLRLTQPGEGTEDTRRRAELKEVCSGPNDALVEDVVRRFVAERLLTANADENSGERWIEVSHEALIRGWPRLQAWIDADRAGLLVHRRLTSAAQEWQRLDRDKNVVYRGTPLDEALEWQARNTDRLNRIEEEFLAASRTAERAARSARRRRLQAAFAAFGVALSIISVIASVAVRQGQEARQQRDAALSGKYAANAANALNVDPVLGLNLALRAIRTAPTEQAEEVLRRATAESRGLAVLDAHAGPVRTVRHLPDQQQVISGGADGVLRVWDVGTREVVAELPGHDQWIYVVRPSTDGRLVASAGADGTVALTDLTDRTRRVLLQGQADERMLSVDLGRDGSVLAAASSTGRVYVVDVGTGTERAALTVAEARVNAVALSPDGQLLAAASDDSTVRVLRTSDLSTVHVLRGHSRPVIGVEFDPAGGRVLSASADGTARLWDALTGQELKNYPVSPREVYSASLDPTGDRFATTGADGLIRIWDVDGVEPTVLRGHVDLSFDASFSAAGDTVLSSGQDGTVRTWAVPADAAAVAPVTGVDLSPDGMRVVSGGTDGHLRMWTSDRLRPLLDIPDHAGRGFAVFSPDGRKLVSYGDNGDVRVRDAADGRELFAARPHTGSVWMAALDPTGEQVVSGGDDGTVVVSSLVGGPSRVLSGHTGPVYAVQFAPDGRSVLSGSTDGTVRLWPLHGPARVFGGASGEVWDVAFSNDGRRIAAVSTAGTARVWEANGTPVALLPGHAGAAYSVRLSADGAQAVTAGGDGTVRFWDVAASRLLYSMPLFPSAASSVDLGRDGRTIVVSSETESIVRTSACEVCGSLEQILALAHTRALRPLTPEEEQRFGS